MRKVFGFAAVVLCTVAIGGVFATGTAEGTAAGEPVTLRYSLWNSNQLPAYQAVADNFMQDNPGIIVEIEQLGWGDYWSSIQTGMVAGGAPDIFTNHLARYPEFESRGQLVDVQPFFERDGLSDEVYLEGLADLWVRDGRRYGLPKDWDTIAMVYNREALREAGVSEEELRTWTWNPENGGTFEEIIARLTIDANGNNGLSPDFDPRNVEQYGFAIDYPGMGAYGQKEWSHFAVSNGWSFNDGVFATEYEYDDPRFVETMEWLQDLALEKGYMAPFEAISGLGASTLFTSRRAAVTPDGSWRVRFYSQNTDFEFGFARLPIGPNGRKSMFNGLADSIWVGTEHTDAAWEWMKYLGSEPAQLVVAEFGVVFPAVETAVPRAFDSYAETGLDVSAFTEQALEPDGTFLFPITDNASEISEIMQETFDSIFLGQTEPRAALTEANARVNATFE